MRSFFRYSLLIFCATVLVMGLIVLSTARFERKANAAFSSKLRISQFRENGPGTTGSGRKDEFIEIYNNTGSVFTVGTTDPSNQGGIGVFASAGNGTTDNVVTLVCLIPNGATIPAWGYVLCTNPAPSAYTLAALGAVNSSTSAFAPPVGTFILPIAGGGNTSVGNYPIINGTALHPGSFNEPDIPNDAGLVLLNVGDNTVGASSDLANGSAGFGATGVAPADVILYDRVGFAPYGSGAPFQPSAGANPQDPFLGGAPFCQLSSGNCGPFGNSRPSLADNYCEGGASGCLRPVGDASTTNHGSQTFYGDSGQYALLRRQTSLDATAGTKPQDTDNNAADFLMVAPKPGINVAFNVTNFPTGAGNGLVSVLGSAFPHNNAAPIDLPDSKLLGASFDPDVPQFAGPNAERIFAVDCPTCFTSQRGQLSTDQDNNPKGTLILRFKFTNVQGGGATDVNRLRFSVDNLTVPCGAATPSPASAVLATGNAKNLSQTGSDTEHCVGPDTSRTAILKMLNMLPSELVSFSSNTKTPLQVRGSVIEDTNGTSMAPNGGGINTHLVRTGPGFPTPVPGSGQIGEFVVSPAVVSSTPSVANGGIFYIAFRMGVVKSGNMLFLFQPEGQKGAPSPAPTVP